MGFNFPQSVMFQYDAMIPILLPGTRVNVSLLLALLSAVLAWAYMQRSFGGYQPGNFQQSFNGPVSAAEALTKSLNVPGA